MGRELALQDIRAALITALNPLSVTHGGNLISVPVDYGSAIYTRKCPVILVRKLENPDIPNGSIGGDYLLFDERYDLSIICQNDPVAGISAEVFLTDAANALQARLKALGGVIAGAWSVRISGDRPLPVAEESGTLVFERVITLRARSEESA